MVRCPKEQLSCSCTNCCRRTNSAHHPCPSTLAVSHLSEDRTASLPPQCAHRRLPSRQRKQRRVCHLPSQTRSHQSRTALSCDDHLKSAAMALVWNGHQVHLPDQQVVSAYPLRHRDRKAMLVVSARAKKHSWSPPPCKGARRLRRL